MHVYVCGHMYVMTYCGNQSTTCKSKFSPSTMLALRIEQASDFLAHLTSLCWPIAKI